MLSVALGIVCVLCVTLFRGRVIVGRVSMVIVNSSTMVCG